MRSACGWERRPRSRPTRPVCLDRTCVCPRKACGDSVKTASRRRALRRRMAAGAPGRQRSAVLPSLRSGPGLLDPDLSPKLRSQEEGGLDNCVPDAQTQQFTEQWICETRTGRRTPSEAGSALPLCTACVPPQNPCELPREALAQSRTILPGFVCCDPRDTCFAPVDLAVPAPNRPAECCRRPTYQNITGGACTQDSDCCPITWMGLSLSHCCQGNERGCRAPGTCSGCGPGTGVSCCEASGLGCRDGEACVGAGDQGRCVACGGERQTCCPNRACAAGLGCFDHPEIGSGANRCDRCGAAGETCCPGDRCDDGNTCAGGVCRPCGNRGELCCAGRRCGSRFQRCTGSDPGHCEQTCGTLNWDCCGERGSIFGPDRGFCLRRGPVGLRSLRLPVPALRRGGRAWLRQRSHLRSGTRLVPRDEDLRDLRRLPAAVLLGRAQVFRRRPGECLRLRRHLPAAAVLRRESPADGRPIQREGQGTERWPKTRRRNPGRCG